MESRVNAPEVRAELPGKGTHWTDEEQLKFCELLSSHWSVEKELPVKHRPSGHHIWSTISDSLQEVGFTRDRAACRGYWYHSVRYQPEFKNAFSNALHPESATASQFRSEIESSTMSQLRSDIDTQPDVAADQRTDNPASRKWSEEESQKLEELVNVRQHLEAEDPKAEKLSSSQLFQLMALQLRASGINRTAIACKKRWYKSQRKSADASYESEDENDGTKGVQNNGSRPHADDYDNSNDFSYENESSSEEGCPWTDDEHNKLTVLLKVRRQLERKDSKLEKLSCRQLFVLVSKQLQLHSIDRTPGACRDYWNRKGQARCESMSNFLLDNHLTNSTNCQDFKVIL